MNKKRGIKMKNKRLTINTLKRLFFFLLFSLFFLLFTACPDPFNPDLTFNTSDSGKGSFMLSINGLMAERTILPATELYTFAAFTLDFYKNGASVPISETRTYSNLNDFIYLDVGNYNLVVTAYMDEGKTKPAAQGSLNGINIVVGVLYKGNVPLKAIIDEGQGYFNWNITYPYGVTAKMTVTPFNSSGTPEQTVNFYSGSGSLTLNSGYYRVIFSLSTSSNRNVERREILHIYKNMDSSFNYVFTDAHFAYLIVTSNANSGAGSLREAVSNASPNNTIIINPGLGTIALTENISISKSLNIEGNGVIITRGSNNNNGLLSISSGEVSISRIWFKDGLLNTGNYYSYYGGGAIYNNNYYGNVILESCIFSGNHSNSSGGAIYNYGTMRVQGCTFYNNRAEEDGGAIYNNGGSLTLTGNLFYGNTASLYPVVRPYGSLLSEYNVVDVALGTNKTQSGLENPLSGNNNTVNRNPMVSPINFRLLQQSHAANIMTSLLYWYPITDFYGDLIPATAAAGAVQSPVSNSGHYIELLINDNSRGRIELNTSSDDGFVSNSVTSVTLTAISYSENEYHFAYWLINGDNKGASNPYNLPLTDHVVVKAVFLKDFYVINFEDPTTSGAFTSGTLRHALTNAIDEDKIIIKATAGQTSIQLKSPLPQIKKSLTIEGNGVIITPSASTWNYSDKRLLNIRSGTVTISRVWFKDGMAYSGAAINNDYGDVKLESCIFSGNKSNNYGGAIYNGSGTMNVMGCTFYDNSADYYCGAIYNSSGSGNLTLTGNLFYGNTAYQNPVVGYSATSNGYNIVDVNLGTGSNESGWTAGTGDNKITTFPISGKTFRLLSGGGAQNVITALPSGYPTKDFYGDNIPANNAAAGAVQGVVPESGIYIGVSINKSDRGSVSGLPSGSDNGLVQGPVTLTANANTSQGCFFAYWMVNGVKDTTNPLTLYTHSRVQAVFGQNYIVNVFTDDYYNSPSGTLRYALNNVIDGDRITVDSSKVTPGTTAIALSRYLDEITKNITIEGNGIIITRGASWTSTSESFMTINNRSTVTVSRIWFKDGKSMNASNGGAAVYNKGNVTLESCIFSGNNSNYGGAIYNYYSSTATVKGCTFFNNGANSGGAIYNDSGTLTLTGNLFYGNYAVSYPVVSGSATSSGYNIVDVNLGTGSSESGWTAGTGDNKTTTLPVSPKTFRFIQGGGAQNVITTKPAGYPAKDFYGVDIPNNYAAAGAVQSSAGSGFYIELVYDSSIGSVSSSPAINGDGIVQGGNVTFTATATSQNYDLAYWLVDGVNQGSANPLTINVSAHYTKVQAVFNRIFKVTIFTDSSNSEYTQGTLRYALTNAIGGDTVRISESGKTIELTRGLSINNSITIEGNGVTITKSDSNADFQLLNINYATVTISRVWFKNGNYSGDGGAVYNYYGNVTFESCIFSGNKSNNYGGAISGIGSMYIGSLDIKGCTFYNNSASSAGTIYYSGTLTLTGNVFYGNTAASSYPVFGGGGAISTKYNVVDVTLGSGSSQCGWTPGTGDTYNPSSLSNTTTLAPDISIYNIIPNNLTGFPTKDFNGNDRTNRAPGAVN